MNLQEKINLAMSQILKVGDTVINWGNNELKVSKVNKKSVTVSSGVKYKYSEIHLPESRNSELIAAVKVMG